MTQGLRRGWMGGWACRADDGGGGGRTGARMDKKKSATGRQLANVGKAPMGSNPLAEAALRYLR